MTKINKLVLHGFKSFANRTELLFGDQFNVVLGPNGSGKSNILDSLCFVLGKSSSKSLRAEKSAHLIYNGGKTKQAAKQAEVSIFFDNKKKTFPIEEEEIKVTRIVKGSGNSVYKINNKTRSRQQVIDLLAVAKINSDAYNIILQGDIVRFVEMNPVERRMVIEEISGISVYEEKKHKALLELEKVGERLKEAEIILKERGSSLKDLQKDRDQALKYKDLNDKIKSNKASYISLQIKTDEKKKEKLDKAISEHQKKIDKIKEEIGKLRSDINSKRDEIKKITEDIEQRGEKEQVNLNKDIEELKVQIASNKNKIEYKDNEISRIKERGLQLNRSLEDVTKKISELVSQKKSAENEKEQNEKDLKELDTKITAFKKKNQLDSAGEIEKRIDEIDKKAEERQKEVLELREKQQNLFREKDKTELLIQNVDEKIEKVLRVEHENKEQINELKTKKEAFKKATLELNKRLSRDSELAAQLGNAKAKLMKADSELLPLKVKSAGMIESIAAGIAVKKILEQKNKIGGIYGTVSEIGTVDKKYAISLEVAAGNKLKDVVVEDDKTAEKCIKYLKENRLGTATFLPLNKIRSAREEPEIQNLLKEKGVHGMAVRLVDYDQKFSRVFSYVFGNSLIVDDIATARRIGIGKAKMATVDGDLAEISGAMKGGFREKKDRIGFMQKEVMDDLHRLEEEVGNYNAIISCLEKERTKNEEEIDLLRKQKASFEGDIIKLEKSLHIQSDDLDADKKQKEGLNEALLETDKDIRKLQEMIGECNKQLAGLKSEKQQFRNKISELKSPTLLAELNAFEQKKTELKERIIQVNADTKSVDMQITSILLPEKENTTKILKQIENEQKMFFEEIKDVKRDISEKQKILAEKEKKAKEFYEQFKESFNKRNAINEKILQTEEQIIRKEEEARSFDQKINNVSIENAQIKATMAGLEEEFKQYQGITIYTNKTEEQLRKDISEFEKMALDLGAVNMRALEVYEQVECEYKKLLEKKIKLDLEKGDVLTMMNEIETKKKDLFMKTFNHITSDFKKIFSDLSTKGEAYLEIENEENPFEGGVRIKVMLSGTKFLDIKSLSGGEQTLTSLAFIFSIQEHDPASFYVLDEVDAALDKHNSEKFARLIAKYAHKAQYIVISHNDSVITEANNLYGITMNEHGMSSVVSLKI